MADDDLNLEQTESQLELEPMTCITGLFYPFALHRDCLRGFTVDPTPYPFGLMCPPRAYANRPPCPPLTSVLGLAPLGRSPAYEQMRYV